MKINVLVVDDAVIVRNRVSKILSTVPEIEVVSVAASGKIALLKIPQVNPDVIILDVEMPEMDGLETLVAIRRQYPKLPVIMFSALTVSGAATTIEALMLGANDYATKPSNLGSIEAANQHILTELVPKIKTLCDVETKYTRSPTFGNNKANIGAIDQDVINIGAIDQDVINIGAIDQDVINIGAIDQDVINIGAIDQDVINIGAIDQDVINIGAIDQDVINIGAIDQDVIKTGAIDQDVIKTGAIDQDVTCHVSTIIIDVVAIGVSTGGPNALAEILPRFPADFPAAILIVQHMPPMFTKLMAERLNSKCLLPVAEAVNGTIVKPGHVWIAPGDFHLLVEKSDHIIKLVTNQAPPENSCRPSVDVLFRSVAQVYGNKSLGVVLTGMGKDGLLGAEHIRACGGHIFAQDQASSVVWGMPGMVVNAGLAESILPINQMAGAILQLVAHN